MRELMEFETKLSKIMVPPQSRRNFSEFKAYQHTENDNGVHLVDVDVYHTLQAWANAQPSPSLDDRVR